MFIARALAAEADLLGELNRKGKTIVLIEHNIGVVTARATEVACLNRELFFDGDPETFIETNALSGAYSTDQRVVHHGH